MKRTTFLLALVVLITGSALFLKQFQRSVHASAVRTLSMTTADGTGLTSFFAGLAPDPRYIRKELYRDAGTPRRACERKQGLFSRFFDGLGLEVTAFAQACGPNLCTGCQLKFPTFNCGGECFGEQYTTGQSGGPQCQGEEGNGLACCGSGCNFKGCDQDATTCGNPTC